MEKIKHWWNVTKYLTKFNDEGANKCQMYFIQRCKQLSKEIELPKQHFGPSVTCSQCSSMWSKNKPQIRIIPGKPCSKSVKQIIKSSLEDNKLSRFHNTLMKKSLKNKMNKIVIKCSVCSKSTEIICRKPNRLRPPKEELNKTDTLIKQKKKKKKKVKDKTAGLNISHIKSSDLRDRKELTPTHSTLKVITVKKPKGKEITPIQKARKINFNKLNNVLNDVKAQKPKNGLSNFLKELY